MDSVDTNVLIRALLKIKPNGPTNGIIYGSRSVLVDLMRMQEGFMIPAPVLGEFLASTDDDGRRKRTHDLLRDKGMVFPVDDAVALLAGRVYQELARMNSPQAFRASRNELCREVVKTDISIACVSAFFKAKTLYTDDRSDFDDICKALSTLGYHLSLKTPEHLLLLDEDPFESI